MRGTIGRTLSLIAVVALALAAWTLLSSGDSVAPQEQAVENDRNNAEALDFAAIETDLLDDPAAPFTPARKGGPKTKCCDPADEPGVGGNPFCFEGHTCCLDGRWRCNNADGSPSCDPGEVCAEGCADRNEACNADPDCCSGDCKSNGRCR